MYSISTFFAHARPETLAKSAVAALVSLVLVDDATALKAAGVDVTLAHRATEESLTTVARRCTVVLAGRAVVTDRAVGALDRAAGRRHAEVSAAGRRRVVERRRRHGRVQVGDAGTAAGSTEINITHVRSICITTNAMIGHVQQDQQSTDTIEIGLRAGYFSVMRIRHEARHRR